MDTKEINIHLQWAQRLCSQREYCQYDIRLKLKEKGVEPEDIEQVIAMLMQQNYLNSARYIRAYVHDKSKLQGWGPEKIRYALRAKQLPDTMIRSALADLDQNAQKETLLFSALFRSTLVTIW